MNLFTFISKKKLRGKPCLKGWLASKTTNKLRFESYTVGRPNPLHSIKLSIVLKQNITSAHLYNIINVIFQKYPRMILLYLMLRHISDPVKLIFIMLQIYLFLLNSIDFSVLNPQIKSTLSQSQIKYIFLNRTIIIINDYVIILIIIYSW